MTNFKSVLITNGSDKDNNAFKANISLLMPLANFTVDRKCVETVKHLINNGSVIPDILFINADTNEQEVLECVAMLRSVEKFNSLPIILYSKAADIALVKDAYAMGATFFWVNPHLPLQNNEQLLNLSVNVFNAKDKTPKSHFILGNTRTAQLVM